MADLAHTERVHLLAAESWLEMDNWALAKQELSWISHGKQVHPEVLRVRYDLCAQAQQWEQAASLAQSMCQVMAGSSSGWSRLAEALHRMNRTQQAREVLASVIDKFPDESWLHYKLACYTCQLGDLKAAWEWLEKALRLDRSGDIRRLVQGDADLRLIRQKEPLMINGAKLSRTSALD